MTSPSVVRVVVADPVPVFRFGIRRLLDGTAHLNVVGEAADASQVIETVQKHQPDVLLLAVEFIDDAGALLTSLTTMRPGLRCIAITSGVPLTPVVPPRSAIGCALARTSPTRDFVHCIGCVRDNQCWPAPRRTSAAAVPAAERPGGKGKYRLTNRESQIVVAVADGRTNKDIASELSITEDTVKHHMSNIFDKMGVHSRLELVLFAMYHGVVAVIDKIPYSPE